MLLPWLAARTSLLAGMQIRQSLDPHARLSFSSWTAQGSRSLGAAVKEGLHRGHTSTVRAAKVPPVPQQQQQQYQQQQRPQPRQAASASPTAPANSKPAISNGSRTSRGPSPVPRGSSSSTQKAWAPPAPRGSTGTWDRQPVPSMASPQTAPVVQLPKLAVPPPPKQQQPALPPQPQQQSAVQWQQQQPAMPPPLQQQPAGPWQLQRAAEVAAEEEEADLLLAMEPISTQRPRLPPLLAGCNMVEDQGLGYRRPGSDTPTTVWVVTPPLDKFAAWMQSIGGTFKPVPGLQPFSYVAHIEHAQLASQLGPDPEFCVEAPPGCDIHITGPSSLEDCGCLVYFESNFKYQRTSREACDAAGKAHYELYTAAGGGQVTESYGKTQRLLDRPGNLGMAMFGWRKNHTTGRLGLYTHPSAEEPEILDSKARKMAMREFRAMLPQLEVTGSLAVMEEAQSKSNGPCINIPGTFISTKSITLNYNIEPHLDDDNAPGELSSIRWWDYGALPVEPGRFLLSPYLCTKPPNGSLLLLQPAVMWHGGQQVMSPTNVEDGEGRYGTALFRKPEVQDMMSAKFQTRPWLKGSAAIEVGDEPMEEGLPRNANQWQAQMLNTQQAWGATGGRIELPLGDLLGR